MLYVFVRGSERKTCETRLSADGTGYELVVAEDGVERVDRYTAATSRSGAPRDCGTMNLILEPYFFAACAS